MTSSNCCFLTCIQVSQQAGQVVWYSHLLQNVPQFTVIHTIQGFGIVNKTEIDVFWNSLAISMIQQMLGIWPLFSLPFLKPAWTAASSRFMYCWSLAWRILSITLLAHFWAHFTSVRWVPQLCGSLSTLLHCLSLGLEWKLTFSSPEATAEFSIFAGILSAALAQRYLSGFEIAQLEFHHLH